MWSLLRAIRKGATPERAAEIALADSRELVRNWNRNPKGVAITSKHELERWDNTAETMLWDRARRLRAAEPMPLFMFAGEVRYESRSAIGTRRNPALVVDP